MITLVSIRLMDKILRILLLLTYNRSQRINKIGTGNEYIDGCIIWQNILCYTYRHPELYGKQQMQSNREKKEHPAQDVV